MLIQLVFVFNLQVIFGQHAARSVQDSTDFALLTGVFKKELSQENIHTKAETFFAKALKLQGGPYAGRAAALISETYFSQLNKPAGESWYNKAQNLFSREKNDLEAGMANLKIGQLLTRSYDFETGLPYLLKSVENFSKTDDHNRQVTAYNVLALAYHDFGDYSKGITYAGEALKLADTHRQTINKNLFWYAYNNLGINYDDSNQPAKAIEAHLKALPYAINASDSSYSYNNLGNTYKKLKNFEEAEKFFKLSLQKSTDYEDQYHLATIYGNMVDIERLRKQYDKAEQFVDSAVYYAQQSGSPEKLLDIYYYTYQLKKERGHYEAATQYLHDHLRLKDSFFTVEKNKAVLQFEARYEAALKEKQLGDTQLNLTKTKLASEQKSIILLLLLFAFLLSILLLFYLKFKSKAKEKQLQMENRLLQERAALEVQKQRLEIAGNLHDSMGAQLTLITTTADRLLTANLNSDDAKSRLNTLSQLCENAVAELRNTLWVLHAEKIHMADLRMKMLNFISRAAEAREDIQFNFEFEETANIPIASRDAFNLIRLLQELTNNAIKHSGATTINIRLLQKDNSLAIQFSDNGKGFDVEDAGKKSFGLTNIGHRVRELNGAMELKSAAGGTNYLIETPI